MNYERIIETLWTWFRTDGIPVILIAIAAMAAVKIANVLSGRIFKIIIERKDDIEYEKKARTLRSLIRYALDIAIIIIAVMMILKRLGIDIGPILAGAGVAGLAIGFGARRLVEDIISGFFIFLEDQIRVDDVVEIAGKGGVVEKVNLRMTILRDLAGNVHYIRNGMIDVVTNMTKGYSRYVFNIGVAYREDIDEVIKVIQDVGAELQQDPDFKDDILEPLEMLGLDEFADSAIVIKARIKTVPIKQWRIGREFNLRLKKRFDERNIEIPFPHITLYMGEDREGKAAPLRVRREDA
jgi:small-conductance mechanosensitive channel